MGAGAGEALAGSPTVQGGFVSFSPASCDQGGATSSGRMASNPELTESLTLSYSHQQRPTKLQSSKPLSPLGPLPSDQEVRFHRSSLGLSQKG